MPDDNVHAITVPENNVLNAALALVRHRLELFGGDLSAEYLASIAKCDPAMHRLLLAARRLDMLDASLRASCVREHQTARPHSGWVYDTTASLPQQPCKEWFIKP